MSNPPTLQYHAQTFRLLGEDPIFAPEAQKDIERCERECGAKLPAAVAEWYSLRGVQTRFVFEGEQVTVPLPQFLKQFSEQMQQSENGLITITNTWSNKIHQTFPWCDFINSSGTGYLSVVVLDGSDDPPVEEERLHPQPFTEHVLDQVWESRDQTCKPWVTVGSTLPQMGEYPVSFGPPQLDFMHENFEPIPVQGCRVKAEFTPYQLPTHVYRFFTPTAWVTVSTLGDASTDLHPARWLILSETEEELFTVFASLWPAHRESAQMGMPVDDLCPNPDLLARFRQQYPNLIPSRDG